MKGSIAPLRCSVYTAKNDDSVNILTCRKVVSSVISASHASRSSGTCFAKQDRSCAVPTCLPALVHSRLPVKQLICQRQQFSSMCSSKKIHMAVGPWSRCKLRNKGWLHCTHGSCAGEQARAVPAAAEAWGRSQQAWHGWRCFRH